MRKLLLYLGVIAFAIRANGQGAIEIYLLGEDVDVSGTTIDLTSGNFEMYQTFDVKNVSGITKTLRITRKKILELSGTEDYLCWGETDSTGTCYSAGLVAPYDPWTTAEDADLVDGQAGWLSTYHVTEGIDGCAQYRYYIVDVDDTFLDSVDVKFCSTVGINEDVSLNISVYPNPSVDFVKVMIDENLSNVEFKLFNVAGDLVQTGQLVSGENELSVKLLPGGVYFYSILNEGEVVKSDKLLIEN